MKYAIVPSAWLMIAVLSSCGTRAVEVQESTSETTPKGTSIYLEGMYATSTRLPLAEFALEHIFDGNANTYWSTPKGAGPDEGFVFYFAAPTYIKSIELEQAEADGLALITEVSIYADGQRVSHSNPALPMAVEKSLRSLFVKIGSTNKSTTEYLTSANQEDLSLERFDPNVSIGISNITLIGENGVLQVRPPFSVSGSVAASSTLHPTDAYNAAQLFDSRKEFVWAEGAKGAGQGEVITFTFEGDQKISSIKIWNGYQRSGKHFSANGRIKSFEFGLKNGDNSSYALDDTMDPQTVKLNEPLTGKEFELTISEVYPGSTYQDLVISELLFFNETVPFVIKDASAEEAVKTFILTTKGSMLSQYVDKRLKNVIEYPDYFSDRSLILRSNRTFVLYDHTSWSDDAADENKEVVADGNWEIVEQREEYAKVRIFGKLFNLSKTLEYYQGNKTTEVVTIFQDNLHITPVGIKGEKFVEAFHSGSSED